LAELNDKCVKETNRITTALKRDHTREIEMQKDKMNDLLKDLKREEEKLL